MYPYYPYKMEFHLQLQVYNAKICLILQQITPPTASGLNGNLQPVLLHVEVALGQKQEQRR